jgi:hypothetical protein
LIKFQIVAINSKIRLLSIFRIDFPNNKITDGAELIEIIDAEKKELSRSTDQEGSQ